MAAKLRYYPMHVDAFDEDPNVLKMDLAAVGLYILSLNEAWKRGSIPEDPEELSRLIRKKKSEVKRSWEQVKSCWIPSGEPGRLINQRLEKERLNVNKRIDQAKNAATTRWDARVAAEDDAPAYAPAHAEEDPDTDARPFKFNTLSLFSSPEKDFLKIKERWFLEELWPLCWRKVDRAEALKAFKKKAASEEVKNQIVAAARRYAAVYLQREPDKRPHMSTWLNKNRFEDELPEDSRSAGEIPAELRKTVDPSKILPNLKFRGDRVIEG